MKNRILPLLVAAALLGGCAQRSVTPPAAQSESQPAAASSVPDTSASKTNPSTEDVPEAPPADSSLYQGTAFHWTSDGSMLALQNGNDFTWVGLDNAVIKTVSYGADETERAQFAFGDTRVLHTDERTRLLRRDGVWTLVNAVLYDLDGEVLREFPAADGIELSTVTEKYEENYQILVTWIDDTHAVINTDSLLAVLDSESGAVTLVEDFREVKRQAYTINATSSYGLWHEGAGGGYYYYRAAGDVPNPTPARPLFRVDATGKREALFDGKDFPMFYIRDELIVAAEDAPAPLAPPEIVPWGYDILYARADDLTLRRAEHTNLSPKEVYCDGRYITYMSDSLLTDPPKRGFYRFDTETGETASFLPETGATRVITEEGATVSFLEGAPETRTYSDGRNAFGLLTTRETEGGTQFLYLISDTIERKNPETGEIESAWVSSLNLFDAASGKRRVLSEKAYCSDESINPQKTHIVMGTDDGYYVAPLA